VNYKLTEDAKADLKRIYRRGFIEFGEARADQYYLDIIERFEQLSEHPESYPAVDHIAKSMRRSVCGRDTIYYEMVDTGILILFILGSQDIKRRLKQLRT